MIPKPQNELAKDGTLDATRFALRIAELVKDEDEDENNEEGAAWLSRTNGRPNALAALGSRESFGGFSGLLDTSSAQSLACEMDAALLQLRQWQMKNKKEMEESLARNLQRLEEAYARSPQTTATSSICANDGTLSDHSGLLGSGSYSGLQGSGNCANNDTLTDYNRLQESGPSVNGAHMAAGGKEREGKGYIAVPAYEGSLAVNVSGSHTVAEEHGWLRAKLDRPCKGGEGEGLGTITDIGPGRGMDLDSGEGDGGRPRSSNRRGSGALDLDSVDRGCSRLNSRRGGSVRSAPSALAHLRRLPSQASLTHPPVLHSSAQLTCAGTVAGTLVDSVAHLQATLVTMGSEGDPGQGGCCAGGSVSSASGRAHRPSSGLQSAANDRSQGGPFQLPLPLELRSHRPSSSASTSSARIQPRSRPSTSSSSSRPQSSQLSRPCSSGSSGGVARGRQLPALHRPPPLPQSQPQPQPLHYTSPATTPATADASATAAAAALHRPQPPLPGKPDDRTLRAGDRGPLPAPLQQQQQQSLPVLLEPLPAQQHVQQSPLQMSSQQCSPLKPLPTQLQAQQAPPQMSSQQCSPLKPLPTQLQAQQAPPQAPVSPLLPHHHHHQQQQQQPQQQRHQQQQQQHLLREPLPTQQGSFPVHASPHQQHSTSQSRPQQATPPNQLLQAPTTASQELLDELEAELRALDAEASKPGSISEWHSDVEGLLARMELLQTGYQVEQGSPIEIVRPTRDAPDISSHAPSTVDGIQTFD